MASSSLEAQSALESSCRSSGSVSSVTCLRLIVPANTSLTDVVRARVDMGLIATVEFSRIRMGGEYAGGGPDGVTGVACTLRGGALGLLIVGVRGIPGEGTGGITETDARLPDLSLPPAGGTL